MLREVGEGSRPSVAESLRVQCAYLGPDAQDTVCKKFNDYKLTFFGSELRLRGDGYIAQPHRDQQGNVLCWNGEVSTLLCSRRGLSLF